MSLDTVVDFNAGSGKTLIAVLLLKYILDKELEDRAMGKPPRIAFFLVRQVFRQVPRENTDHILG